MMNLRTSNLSLGDVHSLLKFEEQYDDSSFTELLSLDHITALEKQQVIKIQNNFRQYLSGETSDENRENSAIEQVKSITTFPLLQLAGFYSYPLEVKLEENIANLIIENEKTVIIGSCDLLKIYSRIPSTNNIPFWVLVIESNKSVVEVRQGLPQLLNCAYNNLEIHTSIWGLVTNGLQNMLVDIKQGNPPTYQLVMPILDLMYCEHSIQLLKILKAICKLQINP